MKNGRRVSTYYLGAAVRWLLVLPIAVIVYLIASALIALAGTWYLSAGVAGFIVSVFTVTFPYWILLQIRAFDPATVIYLTQSVVAAPVAIYVAARAAPAYRFATAIVLFAVQLLLTGRLIFAGVIGSAMRGVVDVETHVPWVVAASALLVIGGSAVAVASVHARDSERRSADPMAAAAEGASPPAADHSDVEGPDLMEALKTAVAEARRKQGPQL